MIRRTPRKWVFPSEFQHSSTGFPGDRIQWRHSCFRDERGFGLNSNSGAVYLFDTSGHGGALVDAVRYGLQVGRPFDWTHSERDRPMDAQCAQPDRGECRHCFG
jgi:hypothetical protein